VNPTTSPTVLEDLLPELGRTGGSRAALDLLVTHQRNRRLLTLRALLDAVRAAPGGKLPDGAAARLLRDWGLLERADRADRAAARRVVQYSLVGAWAEHCLRSLARPGRAADAARGLPYLGAIAASAAARAGLRFTAGVPVRDGGLTLPTLGRYEPPGGPLADGRIRVTGAGGRLLLGLDERHGEDAPEDDLWSGADRGGPPGPAGRTVEVRRGPDGVWRSAAPGWRPVRALTTDEGAAVLLDDADPYRDDEAHSGPYVMPALAGLDAAGHALWRSAWQDAQPWLRLGDGARARETGSLLDAFVPLGGSPSAQCSATKRDAFGALLATTPRTGLELAATLVHELQHAKLLALSELAPLHTAGDRAVYWAPWRRDPRPFDGLLQGAYAHLALADFHLRVAQSAAGFAQRDAAWADHCRCRQQVEAALPQLLGSCRLTAHGRVVVGGMAAHHSRLKERHPPEGHLARATAYVETARALWRRQRA
jgi:HEXXH motif-containing protein